MIRDTNAETSTWPELRADYRHCKSRVFKTLGSERGAVLGIVDRTDDYRHETTQKTTNIVAVADWEYIWGIRGDSPLSLCFLGALTQFVVVVDIQ